MMWYSCGFQAVMLGLGALSVDRRRAGTMSTKRRAFQPAGG
jgi:hypothetical protein